MKILIDTIESIYKSSKVRIIDPLIGTFIVSWSLCNWFKILLLFFGEGTFEKRLIFFKDSLVVGNTIESIFMNGEVILLPLILTISYVFIFPWISITVNFLLHWARDAQTNQNNKYEENIYLNLINLNKAKLRSDPDKIFLEKELDLEIRKYEALAIEAEERAKRAKLELEKTEADAAKSAEDKRKAEIDTSTAELINQKAKFEAEHYEIKLKGVKLQEDLRLREQAEKQKSYNSSLKFPIVHRLQLEIDKIFIDNKIKFSVLGISNCISVVFGYKNIEEIFDDPEFNYHNFDQVSYLFKDHEKLLDKFSKILVDENYGASDFHAEDALKLIGEAFENWDFDWFDDEGIAQTALQRLEEDRFNLLSGDILGSYMAETDTVFEDIDCLELESYEWNEAEGVLKITISGQASGDHRKEEGVPGQSIHFKLTGTCKRKIGKYGLGQFTIESTTGGPVL